jgi:hypothetical protein
MTAEEEWKFTAKYGGTEYSITSHRDAVPEPTTWLLFGTGLLSLAGFSRKKFFKKS